jgi:NAD(P)-dependent dehydrogenase (short-subunit alcohol dehydrogenase family)
VSQGAIINVSSAAANIPGDSFTAYDMVKAAEDKLTKDLAFQYAPQGVRVNCVLPGEHISSRMQRLLSSSDSQDPCIYCIILASSDRMQVGVKLRLKEGTNQVVS